MQGNICGCPRVKSVTNERKYFFGPVPSRRLGLSLGVDIVPYKVCTLDCVYCQIGRTTEKSIQRKDYVPIDAVTAELQARVDGGLNADYITISGSGEPTLNSRLGELIDRIKEISDIPVAVLTNGTLFYKADVRIDCCKADLVLPSLDAGDEEVFEKINRPHPDISIEKQVEGLCEFRKEYSGPIWLEVFLVAGVNTGGEQISKIKSIIERINPEKIQLNTAVRPTADSGVIKVNEETLESIGKELGEKCEVVAAYSAGSGDKVGGVEAESVLSVLKRRPCSIDDICKGLKICRAEALKYLNQYQNEGIVDSEEKDGVVFFKTKQ